MKAWKRKKAYEVLSKHQSWRMGHTQVPSDPKELTEAITLAMKMLWVRECGYCENEIKKSTSVKHKEYGRVCANCAEGLF